MSNEMTDREAFDRFMYGSTEQKVDVQKETRRHFETWQAACKYKAEASADEIGRLRLALDGLLSGDVGRKTLATLATGQGTDTDDGRAWIRAKVMITPNPI